MTRINVVDIYKIIKDELSTYPDVWDEKCWELACKIHAKYENERVTPKYNSTTDGIKRYECVVCGKEVTGCDYCPNCGVRLN